MSSSSLANWNGNQSNGVAVPESERARHLAIHSSLKGNLGFAPNSYSSPGYPSSSLDSALGPILLHTPYIFAPNAQTVIPTFTPSETVNAVLQLDPSSDVHDSRAVASLTSSQDQKLVTPSNCIPGPDPYYHGQPLVTTMESSSSQTQTTPAARMITPLSNETLIETPLFTPLPSPSPPNKTRKALMLSHIAVPSFSRSLRSAHLPNPRDSLKRPRTSRAPKISTTHSREHSLAGTMDRAWARNSYASPRESKKRKPSHLAGTNMSLSGADEHEDGDLEKASTHCSQQKPSENDGAIDAIEIGDEDGEYSEVGSDEEIWPIRSQNSTSSTIADSTPSNSDNTDNPLPPNDEIFDYSTQDAEELPISFDDLSRKSLHRVKPDAVSWFNARFTRSGKSRYNPVTDADSHGYTAKIAGRSRCLLAIERRLEDGGDDPITYSVRPSINLKSIEQLSRGSNPTSPMTVVNVRTRRKAKALGKRKAVLIKEQPSLDHLPVSSHTSLAKNTTWFQKRLEPTFSFTPGLSYPQPLLPEHHPNSHDTAPFLSINPSSPLNIAIPEPLVRDQSVLLGMDLSHHGAHEELDLLLDPSYNPFVEGEDPVARHGHGFPDAEMSILSSVASNGTAGLWEVQRKRCF